MNITNINTENGFIYFHANSVPYHLENMNNEYVINKILKKQEGFELSEQELEHTDFVNEYEQYLDLYILEMKDDWIEILESDTDNYLSEIDSNYFDSKFCEVRYCDILEDIHFLFKANNEFVKIKIREKSNFIMITNPNNRAYEFLKQETELLDLETSNKVFQTMYRESNSYLSVVVKEILIRSHQDFLLSKKQVVVI